jgi:hypothetical protein
MGEELDSARLRREALQIVMQLPSDEAEALQVLSYADELVRGFLAGKPYEKPPPARPPLRLV